MFSCGIKTYNFSQNYSKSDFVYFALAHQPCRKVIPLSSILDGRKSSWPELDKAQFRGEDSEESLFGRFLSKSRHSVYCTGSMIARVFLLVTF